MVKGVGVQPLYCWDTDFESRSEHGYSSVVFVVCCAGNSHCDELITRSEDFSQVCVCVCLFVCGLETSTMRRSVFNLVCCVTEKKIIKSSVYC